MTNTQYIEKILTTVDRILVDTSTLMTPGFQQFINNNRDRLLAGDKKIVVPKAVYTELARHLESSDPEKSTLAFAAVEVIAINKAVFQVESAQLTEEEIAHAFADAQLLSELTLHKSDCNQLLITNDRKLSCDAFDLNQQQSCKGRKVLVCYINWLGELQCCECARTTLEKSEISTPILQQENEHVISSNPVPVLETASVSNIEPEWKFDWLSALIGASGLGALYGFYRVGKALLHAA